MILASEVAGGQEDRLNAKVGIVHIAPEDEPAATFSWMFNNHVFVFGNSILEDTVKFDSGLRPLLLLGCGNHCRHPPAF